MSEKTNIEWTDATWNPVEGCTMAKGSETGGCLNCYAARNALRRPTSGLSVMRPSGPRWTGKVGLVEKRLLHPLSWREPKRVFVNSMSDLFHEALSDEIIDRVFDVMAFTQGHTYQVLTKRPERMLEYIKRRYSTAGDHVIWDPLPAAWRRRNGISDPRVATHQVHRERADGKPYAMANVWLGVSVEDQKTADERIPLLLQTPAAKRFVSYEPALGPVDFDPYLYGSVSPLIVRDPLNGAILDWIIVGGESGPGARPFDISWARQTVEQCRAADVACFVKQLGAAPVYRFTCGLCGGTGQQRQTPGACDGCGGSSDRSTPVKLRDRKGGDMSEWEVGLRVREFPS